MSKDAAIAFLKKAVEDPTLQDKLVAFAKQEGYDFTVDELTDSELDGVAGGVSSFFDVFTELSKSKSKALPIKLP